MYWGEKGKRKRTILVSKGNATPSLLLERRGKERGLHSHHRAELRENKKEKVALMSKDHRTAVVAKTQTKETHLSRKELIKGGGCVRLATEPP